jgi:2-dehydro-3-deoxygalactonokinase
MRLEDVGILYIDGGTTRTRAWAAVGDRVVASETVVAGARDGAREGSARRLGAALATAWQRIARRCRTQRQPIPALGVAAGMITSAEGLVEVAHVDAPAGASDLAREAVCHRDAALGPLPLVLIPGIRSGTLTPDREAVGHCDVMRGEETLALGLARLGSLSGSGVVLSLGSHWKAVHVDVGGRVAGSVSTLTGELIQAVQERTILASAVPREWPSTLPADWLKTGRRLGRQGGLPRAFFGVRLLQQRVDSTPAGRLAFLLGAAIAADEDTLLGTSSRGGGRVVLVGTPPLVGAWAEVLNERGLQPAILSEEDREATFRAGCRAVLEEGRLEEHDGRLSWTPPA